MQEINYGVPISSVSDVSSIVFRIGVVSGFNCCSLDWLLGFEPFWNSDLTNILGTMTRTDSIDLMKGLVII